MKKLLLTYLAVLSGVFIVLSLWGLNSDYAIEQMAWKTQKEYFDILKDPKVIPEQTFNKVIAGYEKVIQRHPDSRMVPGLRFLAAHVYYLKKDYATARQKFEEIIKLYPSNNELHAESLAAIAHTYEAENNWPQAQKVYNGIFTEFPKTQTGMGVPIYLASYYKGKNDYQKTMEAYERAIQHYAQLASQNPDSPVEFNALRYLSNCYLEQKRWREAVETLGKVMVKYGRGNYMNLRTAETIIKTINAVSIYQIKDYDLPIQIYQNIIQQNPDHPLNAYFQKVIGALNTLKAKAVQVTPVK
ncbi:MAG: tetratricopeptide repeat protein [Candidatus Omnitrophica bacterium]|nr:tetratricopeptide repeat protein [Candidatus Omnitrophota bacterium]